MQANRLSEINHTTIQCNAAGHAASPRLGFSVGAEVLAQFQAQQSLSPALRSVQRQVDNVLGFAQSFVNDWKENEGQDDPDCDTAVQCLEAAQPLLQQSARLLDLLVRAAAEIRSNALLFDDTSVLPEIEALLHEPQLHAAVGNLPARPAATGRIFSRAGTEKVASVTMSDIVGDYDVPDTVAEWRWVERNASFTHRDNGSRGVWDHLLNLSRSFDDVPDLLAPVIAEARAAGVAYLLFHQGC